MAKNSMNNPPRGLLRLDYAHGLLEGLCALPYPCLAKKLSSTKPLSVAQDVDGCPSIRRTRAPSRRPPANLMRQLAAAPHDPPLRLWLVSKSPELERHWNGGA